MANVLSLDLRERVVAVVDGGLSRRQTAARFSVSPASLIRWPTQGDRRLGAGQAGRRSQIASHPGAFRVHLTKVAAAPDVMLEELQAKLIDAHGARFGLTTIWRFFDRRGITYKKKRRMPPSNSALM